MRVRHGEHEGHGAGTPERGPCLEGVWSAPQNAVFEDTHGAGRVCVCRVSGEGVGESPDKETAHVKPATFRH